MSLQLTEEEMQKLQHDVLAITTEDNTNFITSGSDSRNTALRTTDKRPTGAINEIKKASEQTVNSVNATLGAFLSIIGNYNEDPTLLENLNALGENILSVILSMNNEIKSLKEQIGSGGGVPAAQARWIQDIIPYEEDNMYSLKYTNVSGNDFELTINGIEYQVDDDFILDEETGEFTWLNDEILLELDDEIVAQYYLTSNSSLKTVE